MITQEFLFVSFLLSFLSLGGFGLSNDINQHNIKTKVSRKQKLFDTNSIENEYVWYRKRDNVSARRTRIRSQNPSNWRLHWDEDTIVEFAGGLSSLHILPDGRHVSAYLGRGVLGRFLFLNDKADSSLSITVTPCMSILRWSVTLLEVNETNFSNISLKTSTTLETFRTQRINTFRVFKSQVGVYSLEIRPLYSDTFVQILVTTSNILEPITQAFGGSTSNTILKSQSMSFNYNFISTSQVFLNPEIVVKRLRGNRIQVKWDASPVNPKFMEYCIVVNTRRDYSTLCEAQGYKYGILPPNLLDLPYYTYSSPYYTSTTVRTTEIGQDIRADDPGIDDYAAVSEYKMAMTTEAASMEKLSSSTSSNDDDFIIGCINKRTKYILTDLKEGRLYYFDVFMRDMLTNLSYPYVRTTLKYKIPKNDSTLLRDSKPLKIRLTENKPTILKFILKKHCTDMTFYIMPCGGGLLSYEILNGNRSLYQTTMVENLDIIKTAEVQPGKYFVKIQSKGARMVEVYLSVKNKKFPLPKLPTITKIFEVLNEKSCDSVTIEWWQSPDARDNEYCIFLKLDDRQRLFKFKPPNQCDVERSLMSDPYVSHSTCLQKSSEIPTKPLQHKIIGLQHSKTYELQLIVRRHNRKALSYDLFHVSTLPSCIE